MSVVDKPLKLFSIKQPLLPNKMGGREHRGRDTGPYH